MPERVFPTQEADGAGATAESRLPSYRELPLLDGVPSAWNVWDEVRLGALNLLTADRVARAARLVQRGAGFSLNLSVTQPDPPLFGRTPVHHVVGEQHGPAKDDRLDNWNTQSSSQWDGFRHVERFGHGHFGGIPDAEHGVHVWSEHTIAGRAVLADVAGWRRSVGRPLRPDAADPIDVADLEACLAAEGVSVEVGDILLVNTGWLAWYQGLDASGRAEVAPLDALATPGLLSGDEMAEFLWDLHIAAIGCDNPALEVWPLGAPRSPKEIAAIRADARREHEVQLHVRILPMLGIPIGELFVLDALAKDCATDGRYECFFTSCPLNLANGVASPPNAIAFK